MGKFYNFLEELKEAGNIEPKIPYRDDEVFMVDDFEEFSITMQNALEERKGQKSDDSLQLHVVTPSEAKDILDRGGKLFMTKDGMSGAYVKHDGYMGGLFKFPSVNRSNASKVLQRARVQAGGRFFDAFGQPTKLEEMYIKNNFRPLVRMDFNESFAPKGWDAPNSTLNGKPDNVFYVYDNTYKAELGEGIRNNNFDEAYNIAKNYKINK